MQKKQMWELFVTFPENSKKRLSSQIIIFPCWKESFTLESDYNNFERLHCSQIKNIGLE